MRSPCCPSVIWCKPTNDRVACHHKTKACNLNLRLLKPCVWLVLLQLRQTSHPGKNIFFDVECNAGLCVLMRFLRRRNSLCCEPCCLTLLFAGVCRLQFVTKHRKIPKFLESENHKGCYGQVNVNTFTLVVMHVNIVAVSTVNITFTHVVPSF